MNEIDSRRRITEQFEASAVCKWAKQQPRVHYEPGCMWIECARGDSCRCRLNNGDHTKLTPFFADWLARFA